MAVNPYTEEQARRQQRDAAAQQRMQSQYDALSSGLQGDALRRGTTIDLSGLRSSFDQGRMFSQQSGDQAVNSLGQAGAAFGSRQASLSQYGDTLSKSSQNIKNIQASAQAFSASQKGRSRGGGGGGSKESKISEGRLKALGSLAANEGLDPSIYDALNPIDQAVVTDWSEFFKGNNAAGESENLQNQAFLRADLIASGIAGPVASRIASSKYPGDLRPLTKRGGTTKGGKGTAKRRPTPKPSPGPRPGPNSTLGRNVGRKLFGGKQFQ